jgi:pimeloyl-ACP methyl ester carboxylesterase
LGGRDRRARRRAPGRTRAHAAVAADRPWTRRGCLALTQPASCLSRPACPGAGLRRSSGRAGLADRGATPVRTPAGERENRGVAHARDRPVPPPTPRKCPHQRRAITTPTIFIIGSDDPYLSIERARPSIDQIHGARLYEVPGGHAPWLVDAQHAAELIATHPHLATGPHPTPAPGESRQANAST